MEKVHFGVIGAGGIADRRTMPGMLLAPHAEITAVMEVSAETAEALRAKYGAARAYTGVRDLVRDPELDAVYIASPVAFHEEAIRAAADAGLHILAEKPLALSATAGDALASYCRERGVLLAAGFMMRFGTYVQAMREAIRNGRLGDVVSVEASFSCWFPDMPGNWRQRRETAGGGSMTDMGVHCIDLIRYITGMEVRELCALQDTMTFQYDVEDSAALLMRLENGAIAVVHAHFNIPDDAACWRLAFFGTRGHLIGHGVIGQEDGGTLDAVFTSDDKAYNAQQDTAGAKTDGLSEMGEAPGFGNLYEREVESFCRSILFGEPLAVPAEDAVIAQRIVETAYRCKGETL